MGIWTRKLALIQPRTSSGKSDVSSLLASIRPGLNPFVEGHSEPSWTAAKLPSASRPRGALLGKVAGSQPVMAAWDAANAAKGALALEAIEDTDKAFRRVERFDTRATESCESLNDQNSVQISAEFRKVYQNSAEILKFEEFSTFSSIFAKFLFEKIIGANFEAKSRNKKFAARSECCRC